MALKLPKGAKNIFSHARETRQGLGKTQKGEGKSLFILPVDLAPVSGTATKEIFYSPYQFSAEGESPFESTEIEGLLISSAENFRLQFYIPHDFTAITDLVVMVVPDTTETINWSVESTWAAVGENLSTPTTDTDTSSLAVTDNIIAELDISAAFTGITAGDRVGFQFNSDTSNIRIIGVRLKYS